MGRGELLDSRQEIKLIDKQGMLEVVSNTPEMFQKAYDLSRNMPVPALDGVKNIVVAGMGGSAISGDILSDLLSEKIRCPIHVNRDYKIPLFVDEKTLFISISYSGNTEETLCATGEAAKRSARIVCISSGGKLKEMAERNGYPLFAVPPGYQPRAALPYLLVPGLRILAWDQEGIREAIKILQKLRKENGPDASQRNNAAKQLANKLVGKIPIIFAVEGSSASAARRLKTQLNENSKITALYSVFPELNHNEIVNLSALKRAGHNFVLICLRSEGDFEKNAKRVEITKSLIGVQLGGVNEIWAKGKTALARLLSLIYFGDLVSVYLALLQGIDPSEIEVILRLKRELSR